MYAAERGHLEIVKFMDTLGSDLKAKSKVILDNFVNHTCLVQNEHLQLRM